ncbi:P-loop containing nucleoside triphosphate hydrolase protein [Xylona heveae TC161]|uniref:ATP-dependent DNA helicase n=1 Tax=Xylona heveae (strain CBS 132557 / TC161) TaxID=1328760 RepID=A0A165JA29_XYLHT|nr:P-loop containing nucleoside triphosphate hydrolase protein [Xylona heveae TC161]KZF25957.1 P-loop containing nucleoside triphosphate hydrolase protein [Xylona heveae TC161]
MYSDDGDDDGFGGFAGIDDEDLLNAATQYDHSTTRTTARQKGGQTGRVHQSSTTPIIAAAQSRPALPTSLYVRAAESKRQRLNVVEKTGCEASAGAPLAHRGDDHASLSAHPAAYLTTDDYGSDELDEADDTRLDPPSSATKAGRTPSIFLSSQSSARTPTHRTITLGPQTNLRQTTLWGGALQTNVQNSQGAAPRRAWPLANQDELPTHHKLDPEALKTWVYPTNLGTIRDYQFNITQRGLYHNLLVALPTGLGKTFIAATIMLNWFRWAPESQIVFVAPTKPLVTQQVEACFGIAGIPKSQTTLLTGSTPPGVRAEEWLKKRVFFMTPQTIINDLKSGTCDPKKIVLVVVDEAHRATGNYAYVEVVNFLRRFNPSFRVLALTATPGATVDAVQQVIDGLGIARVEIRTEESLDIRQYVHSRNIETFIFDPSEEMTMVMDLFSKALQPVLDKLNQQNAYWSKDPMNLTPYGLTQARQKWMLSDAGRSAPMGLKGMMFSIFSILATLAHAIDLLKFHGIGPFYHNLVGFKNDTGAGEKGSKYRKQIIESTHFQQMMNRVHSWVGNENFVGHPKLEYLQSVVLNHFLDAGEGGPAASGAPPAHTRVMIFVHYRDSAEEVVRVLKRNELIRPHVFVGQAHSRGSEGMDQKKQLDVVHKFKIGVYNTLVATSIGEEGLDIGEVDLIVCYDSSASPIRMLQRMGRTGRKRTGNIALLLMRGKEENSFVQAKDNYEKMQHMIASGAYFNYHEDKSFRIVPKEIQPVVDKKAIEIPVENTQPDLPEPRKRAAPPKRPPKKFHMPDGVRAGFVRASRLQGETNSDGTTEEEAAFQVSKQSRAAQLVELEALPDLDEVLLSNREETELSQRYQQVSGGDEVQVVSMPRLNAYPARQRISSYTKLLKHGQVTKRTVRLLHKMHSIGKEQVEQLEENVHMEDLEGDPIELDGLAVKLSPEPEVEDAQAFPSQKQLSSQSLRRKQHGSYPGLRTELVSLEAESSTDESATSGAHRGQGPTQETDTDMDDFIVPDEEDVMPAESAASSPPSVLGSSKHPYSSPRQILGCTTAADSEEDLPDIDTLVNCPTDGRDPSPISSISNAKLSSSSPVRNLHRNKRARRNIVDDSEDSDD